MKRLLLSLIGGVLIPILYIFILASLNLQVESYFFRRLLDFPFRWPMMFLQFFFLFFPDAFDLLYRDNSSIWLVVYVIVANVALYSTVTYLLLRRFWKRKPAPSTAPPQPPQFEPR